MKLKKTHRCGELRSSHVDQTIVVAGWVNNWREHAGPFFIDLRDRYGLIQLVFSPTDKDLYDRARKLRAESVIGVSGTLRARTPEAVNENLETGEVEIHVETLEVYNLSKTPPFEISEFCNAAEDLRLKYRYLDLRRKPLRDAILLRSQVAQLTRSYFSKRDFVEIETPFLTKSTPEGARDFLVPSRLHHGQFYALPQSPQTYKQILMMAGFDRYFQIVKCFRDEDLRKDRQPEFTQIDVEMSFVDEDDVMGFVEGFIVELFKEVLNVEISGPFPRMTYAESMDRFGSDKPDTRFGLELKEITDGFGSTEFKVFRSVYDKSGYIGALVVDEAAGYSRKQIDNLNQYVISLGAKGVAHLKFKDGEFDGGISKFMGDAEKTHMIEKLGLSGETLVLVIANESPEAAKLLLGHLRNKLAEDLEMIDDGVNHLHWTVDFPMLEYSEEDQRYVARHHPFTSPREADRHMLESEPENILARAYDLVWNGNELAGGSIRIHERELQQRVFDALNISPEEAQSKFGFLLESFEYGAPPHGGIAFGFDRMIMLLARAASIRDVIAFPKTASAVGLMEKSPSLTSDEQLKELGITVIKS